MVKKVFYWFNNWLWLGLTILIAAGVIFPYSLNAQGGVSPRISVAPHTFELDVFPGEVRKEKIKIFNQSQVAVPISVKVTDFTAEEESGQMLFDESAADPSIAARKWINLETSKFILDPGEKGTINFSIEVPENAEPGGHYAVVLLETTFPSFYFKEDYPRAVPTLGVLFLLSVKTFNLESVPQEKQIEIVEFGIPKEQRIENLEKTIAALTRVIPQVQAVEIEIAEKAPSDFILRIKNNDIFHHKLEGKLLILNAFGQKIGRAEIKRITILPGKTRRFPIKFELQIPSYLKWLPAPVAVFLIQNTFLGNYRAVLGLSEEKSGLVINRTMGFWIFSGRIILVLILLITLVLLMRKRIKAVLKVLVKS